MRARHAQYNLTRNYQRVSQQPPFPSPLRCYRVGVCHHRLSSRPRTPRRHPRAGRACPRAAPVSLTEEKSLSSTGSNSAILRRVGIHSGGCRCHSGASRTRMPFRGTSADWPSCQTCRAAPLGATWGRLRVPPPPQTIPQNRPALALARGIGRKEASDAGWTRRVGLIPAGQEKTSSRHVCRHDAAAFAWRPA